MKAGDIQLKSIPRELSGKKSRLSPAYMLMATPHCLRLLAHCALTAAALALFNAGSNMLARMAMTTSSSINVKATLCRAYGVVPPRGRFACQFRLPLSFIFSGLAYVRSALLLHLLITEWLW